MDPTEWMTAVANNVLADVMPAIYIALGVAGSVELVFAGWRVVRRGIREVGRAGAGE